MSHTDKYVCLPSRGQYNFYKNKLQGALKAHSLLRKKADALQVKFRRVLLRIMEHKGESSEVVSSASIILAKAKYVAGNFNHLVLTSAHKPSITVCTKRENVAGVILPVFDCEFEDYDPYQLLCVGKGGQQIKELKTTYQAVVKFLIGIASLQISYTALEAMIHVTNQRVNALEFIVVPKIQRTLTYIIYELDEYEREDFYRMKKTKDKKAQKAKQHAKRIADLEKKEPSILEMDHDQDILF